jgi:hypothetical protein
LPKAVAFLLHHNFVFQEKLFFRKAGIEAFTLASSAFYISPFGFATTHSQSQTNPSFSYNRV